MASNQSRRLSSKRLDSCLQRYHEHLNRLIALYTTDRNDVEGQHDDCEEATGSFIVWHTNHVRDLSHCLEHLLTCTLFLSVPITAIPALTRAGYLFSNNTDDTWAAVIPTIWFQISLSLSILTACIPSMKSLIDSLMGSTAGATVQAPYELRDIEINGKKKVRATAPDITGSRSTSVKMSSITKGKGSFRIHQHNTSGNPRQNYYFETHGTKPTRSDSMTDLTEGVILRSDQFEVQYEDGGTGSSLHESLDDHLSKAAWKRDA